MAGDTAPASARVVATEAGHSLKIWWTDLQPPGLRMQSYSGATPEGVIIRLTHAQVQTFALMIGESWFAPKATS